ncbi:MAG: beta-(1-6) glucans synthase [Pseudolabrys sp.]
MRLGTCCLALAALVIIAVWAFLGQPVSMPRSPLAAGDKLYCLSYAPFRGSQTPLDPSTQISAAQIEADLSQLAKLTDCVRTYSTDYGLDQIPGIAARHGLKVMQGLWLSSHADKNRIQIEGAVDLANRFPDTIRSVIVGNEVLLRGEMSETDLIATMREVKSRVKVPVTYADVWEFWLRNRDVAAFADFITIHILPYWEDDPIPAAQAGAHVVSIRSQVVQAFAGKDVIIGEVGWPSEGRMRDGALPSPANQARVIQDVLALAARDKFRVNVIEAYDEPWKRALEGTVGGHWGLFDDAARALKFEWGAPVSNHPMWKLQAAGGVCFAAIIFGAAFYARRDRQTPLAAWLAVTANAIVGGALIGWAIANAPRESLGVGGWLNSLAMCAVALLAPPVLSAAIMRGTPLPSFAQVIGPVSGRVTDPLARATGAIMIVTTLIALMITLGLAFNPRYKDFPFAPMTAAIVPILLHSLIAARPQGRCGAAEIISAALIALAVPYIVLSESFANWQSLWLCAALVSLAFSLARVRGAQS